MGAARDRARGADQPARPGAEKGRYLPAPVAEGPRDVPGGDRPPRVLAARGGPQPRHGEALRFAGLAGVLRPGGLRPVAAGGGVSPLSGASSVLAQPFQTDNKLTGA